ncbi:MAG TPA: sulfotransferase domain-containing protein [Candidatus Binataceae bacterium]|nr:sulfotransferase domain-containing protein [Candidatus Binataceae bacterium]
MAAGRLPDFIGVGPARTGTTWLDNVLRGHVGLPAGIKETGFFGLRYSRGIEWYRWHFRDCKRDEPVGEICPYFSFPLAPTRISRHIPRCKIICTIRDPVERAYSHYKMLRYFGYVKPVSFEQALTMHTRAVEDSRYAFYLVMWQQKFGKENVLITFYDDLRDNPQQFVDSICNFIGIPSIPLAGLKISDTAVHSLDRAALNHRRAVNGHHFLNRLRRRGAYRTIDVLGRAGLWKYTFGGGEPFPALPPDVEARIRERFRPEISALERLIGRDLTAWKVPRVSRRFPTRPAK